MKIQEFFRIHKKKVVIAVAVLVVLIVAGCAIFFLLRKNGSDSSLFGQGMFRTEGITLTENMVSASGITGVGVTQENFEVENLTEGLLIEEIYVSSNEEVREGTPILKLSEESVETARQELEKQLREADLAYRAGVIEYEQNKITIQYERDLAVLNGEQAQAVYEETIASLTDSVDRAQEELDTANEQIAEYEEIEATGDYYDAFQVDDYKTLYDENLELLVAKMEEWGATWNQVVSGSGQMSGSMAGGSARSVSGADGGAVQAGPTSDQLYVLQSLYKVLEQNLKDYEQAQAEYEDAAAGMKLELQTLKLSLSSLEKNLSEAKANYETQILQAKLTKEQTLAEAERAERNYETSMEKAESDYETLKDAREEAEENLQLFEELVGDGYYYALQNGTILRVMQRENQYLTSGSTIFMYTNPEEITVTVSVAQEDIAKITIGEEVYIESEDYGSFKGVVKQINPISQSDSRTNITYDVTVAFTGNAGALPTNETVTVIFGIGGAVGEEEK